MRRQSSRESGPEPAVDIRRVAEVAGVSTATVSRALSGKGPVSEGTRRRVLDAAARLDYLPRAAAQSLRTTRTMTVGVLVPDLSNPVFVPFLRGVQHAAQSLGYSVIVVDGQRSADVEREAITRLRAQRVDALVLAGASRAGAALDELARNGTHVVDADRWEAATGETVASLERPAAGEMCAQLADLGHERIAVVTSREPAGGAAGRRRADVRAAWQTLGSAHVVEDVALGWRRDPESVAATLAPLLGGRRPVTALVAGTHVLALPLLRGLRAAGVEVPGRCSFVTYGDSEWAEAFWPSISAVSLDLFSVAVALTGAALGAPSGGPLPAGRFVRRESVAAAPRRR
jgi:LacI family transcriptional regulator